MRTVGPLFLHPFFLNLCSKFSTSHSVKVLRLCQLISSRITAVINMMSTCQSIKVTPVKTSNGALLPYKRVITWSLCNESPLIYLCDNERNGLWQVEETDPTGQMPRLI